MIRNFLADEQGATLVEYMLICSLAVVAFVVVIMIANVVLIGWTLVN